MALSKPQIVIIVVIVVLVVGAALGVGLYFGLRKKPTSLPTDDGTAVFANGAWTGTFNVVTAGPSYSLGGCTTAACTSSAGIQTSLGASSNTMYFGNGVTGNFDKDALLVSTFPPAGGVIYYVTSSPTTVPASFSTITIDNTGPTDIVKFS